MTFQLRSARDLISLEANNLWQVTGGHPVFDLVDGPALVEGWHVVTTDFAAAQDEALDSSKPPPIALRFLPDSGSVPLARRPVPVVAGKRTRVVHVPAGTARVQLDVTPWLDSISVSYVTLRPIPNAVAASIMSADVAASSVGGSTDSTSMRGRLRAAREARGNRAMLEEIAVAYEHLQHRRSGDGVDYPSWRIRNATLFDDDAARLQERCAALPGGGPSISVVMPVYNPAVEWLDRAIMSVREQTYERWQLCLVNDASTNPDVTTLLDRHASEDSRVLVIHRTENGHIAAATNDGLSIATGEFVAFMDHDDELAPFALGAVALKAATADLLYTDEDKIDAHGKHYESSLQTVVEP